MKQKNGASERREKGCLRGGRQHQYTGGGQGQGQGGPDTMQSVDGVRSKYTIR